MTRRGFLALATGALITLLVNGAAQAREYKWCAYSIFGGTNCGYNTFAQCRTAISGVGCRCQRHPA